MLKKGTLVIIIGAFLTSLAGCESFFPEHKPSARLPSRQQLCTQLKHQLNFEYNPIGPVSQNNVNQQYLPITQARLMNQYQRYNCTDYEN